jgi:hypothetical protein
LALADGGVRRPQRLFSVVLRQVESVFRPSGVRAFGCRGAPAGCRAAQSPSSPDPGNFGLYHVALVRFCRDAAFRTAAGASPPAPRTGPAVWPRAPRDVFSCFLPAKPSCIGWAISCPAR